MFHKNFSIDDVADVIQKIINKNPDKIKKIMEKNKGVGQLQEIIDGVKYQIGFKERGKIRQFHIKLN